MHGTTDKNRPSRFTPPIESWSVIMATMTTGSAPGDGRGGWYTRRGITVADDLDQLHGPTSGSTPLPHIIESSHRAPYDFADPHQRSEAYRVVLAEAWNQDQLSTWLDRDELLRAWHDLYLPAEIRAAWQAAHPALAAIGGSADVPQPR